MRVFIDKEFNIFVPIKVQKVSVCSPMICNPEECTILVEMCALNASIRYQSAARDGRLSSSVRSNISIGILNTAV